MLFADCPLCDEPAPVDVAAGALECPTCAVRVELAADEESREVLAPAA